jgi:hypothetical protein
MTALFTCLQHWLWLITVRTFKDFNLKTNRIAKNIYLRHNCRCLKDSKDKRNMRHIGFFFTFDLKRLKKEKQSNLEAIVKMCQILGT